MPRTARIIVPNYPHHLIQRGHNRTAVFFEDADYRFYLKILAELKAELGFRIFDYSLMTNHTHLVIEPGDDASTVGKLMKRLGGRYTQYINRVEERSGTVWEGRYKSSPIDTNEYLLECCRYVDLNAKRAGMVVLPEQYRWSGYSEKIGCRARWLIDEDLCYLGLGRTREEREEAYRDWVMAKIPGGTWELIRTAARCGWLTGGERFIDAVEQQTGRRFKGVCPP